MQKLLAGYFKTAAPAILATLGQLLGAIWG